MDMWVASARFGFRIDGSLDKNCQYLQQPLECSSARWRKMDPRIRWRMAYEMCRTTNKLY